MDKLSDLPSKEDAELTEKEKEIIAKLFSPEPVEKKVDFKLILSTSLIVILYAIISTDFLSNLINSLPYGENIYIYKLILFIVGILVIKWLI